MAHTCTHILNTLWQTSTNTHTWCSTPTQTVDICTNSYTTCTLRRNTHRLPPQTSRFHHMLTHADTQFLILSSPTVKTHATFLWLLSACVYGCDIGPIDLGLLGCFCAGEATRNLLSCRPQQIYSEPQTPINGRRVEERNQEGVLSSQSLTVFK